MSYTPPLVLTILSAISIGIAALVALWIAFDIALRRGWKTMMSVMIPVYVINALYLWPITLWAYLKYGRPSKPQKEQKSSADDGKHDHDGHTATEDHHYNLEQQDDNQHNGHAHDEQHKHTNESHEHSDAEEGEHHHHGSDRPMFATVTIGVCHCGAGCVLGDVVGEWLVYGTNAAFGNPPRLLWAEYLVGKLLCSRLHDRKIPLTATDFAFAFAFGIVFQYFSIAPMSGDYGPRTILRALKADALSLLSFEIGLFGWMAAFQLGIFNDQLEVNTITYWWMMQIGMFIGHWTGVPINYWLIKKKIKEPCA